MKQKIILIWLLTLNISMIYGQGYVAQNEITSIVETQTGDINDIQPVKWEIYDYRDHIEGNNKGYWSEFTEYIESKRGEHAGKRRYIIEMANRISADNFKPGQKLLIPTTFAEDYRAYSPYPFEYEAAAELPKLLVVDKYTQTFGAYEYGKLIRWGIVSTGLHNETTPPGRYNFNWKAEYRQSTAAPAGEIWELYWMFNFHAAEGIHVHQYALPIAAAASHGCVRFSVADAQWNYKWANGWVRENGRLVRNGTPLIIINQNPEGRPAHWQVNYNGEIESLVNLPDDIMRIPAGTDAQKLVAWNSGW